LTGVSVVCTLNFTVGILAFSLFLIIVIATKLVSLGSVLGTASAPVLVYFFYHHDVYRTVVTLVIAVFIIAKHKSNIERLIRGEEPKISSKSKKRSDGA